LTANHLPAGPYRSPEASEENGMLDLHGNGSPQRHTYAADNCGGIAPTEWPGVGRVKSSGLGKAVECSSAVDSNS